MQSTQGTTQQDVPSTSEFQDLNSDNFQYDDDDLLEVSKSFEYDWRLTGHRFIGERVSIIYPNGLTAIGTVQKYLPPDGDDEALFHILHDDGDKESKVVTFKRLMNFKRPILIEFLQYLDLDDVDGVTRKVLSNLILKAYKNFISVNSSK